MNLDLRREVRRLPPLTVDVEGVSAGDRAAAIENWRNRMVSEHVSARVFGVLTAQMIGAGLPRGEIHRVSDMARQELDHGLACARVLAALGEAPVAALPVLDEVPLHEEVSPLEGVLRNVLSIGCASETVAVALVGTEREHAGMAPSASAVRGVLDGILRDEVKHARFGWRLVARLAPSLDPPMRARLDAYLEDVFAHEMTFHAPFLRMPNADAPGLAIGAPHGRSSWAVFVDTMQEVVVPGLERHGFRAHDAWRRATEARAADRHSAA